MTRDDKDIVSAVRRALAGKVGEDRFELWFGRGTRLRMRGAKLHVDVANRFSLEWLRQHFSAAIASAAQDVLGTPCQVTFRIDESLGGEVADGNTAGETTVPAGESERAARPRLLQQEPFRRPPTRLDEVIVGDGNRVAVTAAEMVVRALGEMSPLFIHGPHGVGKTHLLEGILSAVRAKSPGKRCVYLSAEQFTTLFLEALHGTGLPSFRRKYRDVALLVLDDIQFFLGKRATIVELLHTVDTVLRQGNQLVLAADCPPAELIGLGHELTTRMSSGLVCGIAAPGQRTRLGIARRWADQLQVDVPEDVLRWVAAHVAGDARLLRGAVNRLRATAAALEQPVTREMAQQHLADLVQAASCLVRLADVEQAVCRVFELNPKSLRSARKTKVLSQPRMLAMWLARKYTRAGLSEISEHFGRRSHSTVISASRTVARWLSEGTSVEGPHGSWQAEQALRKIEQLLHSA